MKIWWKTIVLAFLMAQGMPLLSEEQNAKTDSIEQAEPLNSWRKVAMKVRNLSEVETVKIDNAHIQSYRGKDGIWIEAHGSSIQKLAEKYSVSADELKTINEFSDRTNTLSYNQWVFVPYTQEYVNSLEQQGFERMAIEVPKGEFIWPVEGIRITSRLGKRWGRMHPGLDIATPAGTIVVGALEGEVVQAGFSGAYGYVVSIAHADNYITRYAHLSQVLVKKGDKVRKGQVIALSGSTGRSTGPHLHFEVRYKNVILDPEYFLPDFEESMKAIARAREEEPVE